MSKHRLSQSKPPNRIKDHSENIMIPLCGVMRRAVIGIWLHSYFAEIQIVIATAVFLFHSTIFHRHGKTTRQIKVN